MFPGLKHTLRAAANQIASVDSLLNVATWAALATFHRLVLKVQ